MTILLDTNVILDYALEGQLWFADSEQIFYLTEQKQITTYISASTISDIYYILEKIKGKELALIFIKNLISICQIATVDSQVIFMALNADIKDFEDAIQYSTTVTNQLKIIVTRNIQDFPVNQPEILTPSQFLKKVEKSS